MKIYQLMMHFHTVECPPIGMLPSLLDGRTGRRGEKRDTKSHQSGGFVHAPFKVLSNRCTGHAEMANLKQTHAWEFPLRLSYLLVQSLFWR